MPLARRSGRRTKSLSQWVAEGLGTRLERGEWAPGDRLPGEYELAEEFGVSRATVRTALRSLESRGLTVTRHGLGTFATAASGIVEADLHRLESLSETIRRHGREPGMRYRSLAVRAARDEEAARLVLEADAAVLAVERCLTADGEVVAWSADAIPIGVLGGPPDVTTIAGSLFAVLADHGIDVASAVTDLHASSGTEITWADGDRGDGPFLRLDQTHFDERHRPVLLSRTWFVEGRFQFRLIRVRSTTES